MSTRPLPIFLLGYLSTKFLSVTTEKIDFLVGS